MSAKTLRLLQPPKRQYSQPFGKGLARVVVAVDQPLDAIPPPRLGATTIHSLLGVRRAGHDGHGWGFNFNEANPLPYSQVVVDEASMLSTELAASLFRAVAPDCQVLMVGDTGQLLPVGHGAPMRDMIRAGVPRATLTEIRRSSGDIAFACKSMAESGAFKELSDGGVAAKRPA